MTGFREDLRNRTRIFISHVASGGFCGVVLQQVRHEKSR